MMASGEPAILTGHDAVSPLDSPGGSGSNINNAGASATDPSNAATAITTYVTPFGFSNPRDYFAHRSGLIDSAIQECVSTLVFPNEDGAFVGSWLLTEISSWDNERERIVILTKYAMMVIKYDFIAMKKMEFKRVSLTDVDTVVMGNLVYPKSSLVPRINGITNGLSTVVRECVLDRFSQPNTADLNRKMQENASSTPKDKCGPFQFKYFEPRDRNMNGVRILWNRGQPMPFLKKWNPFETDIPYNTLTHHPLFYHEAGDQKDVFNIENFTKVLVATIEELENTEPLCVIQHNPILLQSYVGLVPMVHNKTSLGFFKVRGKFSF